MGSWGMRSKWSLSNWPLIWHTADNACTLNYAASYILEWVWLYFKWCIFVWGGCRCLCTISVTIGQNGKTALDLVCSMAEPNHDTYSFPILYSYSLHISHKLKTLHTHFQQLVFLSHTSHCTLVIINSNPLEVQHQLEDNDLQSHVTITCSFHLTY